MAKNNAVVIDDQDKPFSPLNRAVEVPSLPTKTARSARKAGEIATTPERSNKSSSTNNITLNTAKSSWLKPVPRRAKSSQQKKIFAFSNSKS